jgi:hypothetical protein
LHYRKLPLDIQHGGLCCLYGSSFAGSFTNTYNASAAIPHDAAASTKSRQISPWIISRSVMERMTRQVRCWASLASLVLAFLVFQRTSVQRWQSFTVHLMGASSPACHESTG